MNSEVSRAALGRLPVYLKYLKSIDSKTISATKIAEELGFGEVQVRKDLAAVSGKGRPKIGYETAALIERLKVCLGQDNHCRAILAGAGKLGRALLDYEGFSDYGLEIAAAFDRVDEKGISEAGKPIYPLEQMREFCRENGVKIGIITVPKEAAQEVCDMMIKDGITAVWSFAPIKLNVPEGVAVRQENLALSLAHLNKQI